MAKQKSSFHINSSNKVGRCTTTPEKCPVSNSENHFDSVEEANAANEKILAEKYDRIQSFKKEKKRNYSLELSDKIYQHPRGYDFEQLMNSSKNEAEQLKHIKNFDYGTVGKGLILGEQSHRVQQDIREKISEHMDQDGYIPVEYSVTVVEDKNETYSVYLADEDGILVQASHKVRAENAYNSAQEMYEIFDKDLR